MNLPAAQPRPTGPILVAARWVVGHRNGKHCLIENGEVVFNDGTITFVGRAYPGEVARRIDYGHALIGPGFIDLDALSDLDTTILGYDNQPAMLKGRVWPQDYVDAGPYEMLTREELDRDGEQWIPVSAKYNLALHRARKIGGRKFHNKQYGGGIVFGCVYNLPQLCDLINKLTNQTESETV